MSLTFCLLFISAMFGWWMYESGHLMTLAQLIGRGFRIELWEHSALISSYLEGHSVEYMLNMLGFNLYLAGSCFGLFYMLSKGLVNSKLFAYAVSIIGLLGLVYFFPLTGLTGIFAGRWYPVLQLIGAIPLALGFLLLCQSFQRNISKISLMVSLVIIISFLSITRPNANMDSPIYSKNTMSRFTLTESELDAAASIQDIYQGLIKTDSYYWWPFHFGPLEISEEESNMTANLVTGDYSEIEGLVIIRSEIVDRIAFIRGPYKLDHDPRQVLASLSFNCIYKSGSVTAFLRE